MNLDFSKYLRTIEENISSTLDSNCSELWQKTSFGILDSCVNKSHFEPLIEPTTQLVKLGGKRWRPLLLVLCALSQTENSNLSDGEKKQITDNAYHLTPLVEFIHTASLIHDDIEDSSDSRRGAPAAYITYGTDVAINAGSWLYFEAATVIDSLNCSTELKNRLYSNALMELRRLHLGQAMDIKWHREKNIVPSTAEYLSMVKCKTGTLSSLAAKIGCTVAGYNDETVTKAGIIASEIGAGFQIIDDVINLTTGNPGKIRGDDIVEGKKSLPVLMYAQKNTGSFNELSQLFSQAAKEGIKSPAVEKAIKILTDSGCIEEARIKGISLINEGCKSMVNLFGENNSCALAIRELFTRMIPV